MEGVQRRRGGPRESSGDLIVMCVVSLCVYFIGVLESVHESRLLHFPEF